MPKPMRGPWKRVWSLPMPWRGQAKLHRMAAVIEDYTVHELPVGDPGLIHARVVTCCGRELDVHMPGFITRINAHRCKLCCRSAGVDPELQGVPGNGNLAGPRDDWQEDY